MPSVPSSVALTSIADGSSIVAADHRNNYAAVQTAVNGLIAVANVQPPGTELAYNEFFAPVPVSAVNAATANTVVTASAVTFDGATAAIVEFHAPRVDGSATAGCQCLFDLWDGATDLGMIGSAFINPAATLLSTGAFRGSRRLTPSSAAHTFSVRAWASTGTATVTAGAGGAGVFLPGYIRIVKV